MKKIKKSLASLLGFSFVIGVVFAASIWNVDIPDKTERDSITSGEFNLIIDTLKNIYNDGTNIGINQPNPQATLDVNGDIIVSGILNKDTNDVTLGCSTLGTDDEGNFKCNSSYDWVYSSYGNCSKSCGGGTKTRTATCKRDDGEIVDNSFCTTTPVLSSNCNTLSCQWNSGGWSNCSKSCGGGTKTRSVDCINPNNNNSIVSDSLCLSSKPTTSTTCNTHSCCTWKCDTCKVKDYIQCSSNCSGGGRYKCNGCASNNRCNNNTGNCMDWWVYKNVKCNCSCR